VAEVFREVSEVVTLKAITVSEETKATADIIY
jgi:hypothetical protein